VAVKQRIKTKIMCRYILSSMTGATDKIFI